MNASDIVLCAALDAVGAAVALTVGGTLQAVSALGLDPLAG
jgi:hypothetical protein